MSYQSESCREYAYNHGAMNPDFAWISTPFDSWEPNPFYVGPPVRHPEDYDEAEVYGQAAPRRESAKAEARRLLADASWQSDEAEIASFLVVYVGDDRVVVRHKRWPGSTSTMNYRVSVRGYNLLRKTNTFSTTWRYFGSAEAALVAAIKTLREVR